MANPVDPTAPYTQFGQDQQANQRAALSAMATGGTAARQEVEAAQQRIQSDKASAVQRAALESQQFNAPAAAQQVISQQISDPYDLRTTSLSQGEANRQRDIGARSDANDTYFNQLGGLIPAYQAQAKTAYDSARAKVDAQNALQAQQLQEQANEAQARLAFDQQSLQNQTAQQQWQQGFSEKQFAAQQAQDARDFAEDVRRYGIAQAEKNQAVKTASRGGGGGGGGGGSSSSAAANSGKYSQFGSTVGEQKAQMMQLINQNSDMLNNSGYPQSTNAAENLPHDMYSAQLIDQQLGKPIGTTAALLGLPQKVTPLAPSTPVSIGQSTNTANPQVKAYQDAAQTIQVLAGQGLPSTQIKLKIVSTAAYQANKAAYDAAMKDYL